MHLEEVFWENVRQPRGEVDEHCSFGPVEPGNNCPSFRLTIEESWSDTKELLAVLTATVSVDEATRSYVANHPLWSKDCRPFLLWEIYESFWRVKLLEAGVGQPNTFVVVLGDSKRQATTKITIAAQAFYQGNGSPVVHLPNYANTHVYDQLAKIYQTNRAAQPSDAWVTQTKERILGQHHEKRLAEQRQQELRLRHRPKDSEQLTLFLDETGDVGFKTGAHYYLSCGVIVRDSHLDAARESARDILSRNWQGTPPSEIHFSKLPSSKFTAVTEQLAQIFLQHVEQGIFLGAINIDFCRYLLRCEAEFNRAKERPIRTNIADLLSDKAAYPGRKLLILHAEEIITHIGIDSLVTGADLNIVHDEKRWPWMNAALETGFERARQSIRLVASELYGQRISPSMTFTTSPSQAEPALWMSDWIAWEFGAWLRDEHELSPAFKSVQSKLRFYSFGNQGQKVSFDGPGGREIARFPDQPREIGAIL
jgi:hypothetical protein